MVAEEMEKHISGTPVDSWLELWLPGKTLNLDNLPEEFSNKKFHFQDLILESKEEDSIKNEGQLYPKLCEVIQNVFDLAHHGKGPGPRLVIKDTSGIEGHSPTNHHPDGSVYMESDEEAYRLTPAELETAQGSADRRPFMARPAFSKSIAPLEIKFRPYTEAFGVSKKGELILPTSAASIKTRGQLFEYCLAIFGRQPRQHLFAVHIFRNMVTLLAMDRVSVAATIPFDYVEEPLKLMTFFYRLALSDPSALGLDPTMTLASKEEKAILYESLPDISVLPEDLEGDMKVIHQAFLDPRINGDLSIWPVYKVTVTSKEEDNAISTSEFLISRPQTSPPSLYGRGGKGYIAFDLEKHDFVFLKDSWRADSPYIHSEVKIYKEMRKAGLTNKQFVATMRCGGDVSIEGGSKIQRTRSQKLLKKRALARIHCRLVLNEIAHHISNYTHSSELIFIMRCALYAHEKVWKLVGVLHGDVSDNNIMVVYRGDRLFGILIDWDLCKYQKDLDKVRNGNRSGTWPFISALRLQYPKKRRELSDDLESFIHVITWHALCYHTHTLSPLSRNLAFLVHEWFFDFQSDEDGLYYGCFRKFDSIMSGRPGFELLDDPIFNQLIHDLFKLAQEHYQAIDLVDYEKLRPAHLVKWNQTVEKLHKKTPVKKASKRGVDGDIVPWEEEMDEIEAVSLNPTPPPPVNASKPVKTLETHDMLAKIFSRYLHKDTGWEEVPKVASQFKELLSAELINEQGKVVASNVLKAKVSSSRKRPATEVLATKSKRGKVTASSGVASGCSNDVLVSVREETDVIDEPEANT